MHKTIASLLLTFFAYSSIPLAAEWHEATIPASFKRLNTLEMVSRDDGWAGGRDGLVLRWDGHSWQRQDIGVSGDIVAIAFSTDNRGWMVTYDVGTQKSFLHRYEGLGWSASEIPTDIRATAMTVAPDGSVWVFGYAGQIVRYRGGEWNETPSPGYRTLLAATATSDGSVWTVGEFGTVWKLSLIHI